MRMRLALDPRSASPHEARRFVTDVLETWNETSDVADLKTPHERTPLHETIVLLVSELVTNAVLHAGTGVDLVVSHRPSPPGMTANPDVSLVRVEVHDHSSAQPAVRAAEPTDESGRGLALVDALADRWGVVFSDAGKQVWFELYYPVPSNVAI